MTLWQAIKHWGNPTRSWCFDPEKPLELDLDSHCFCGVGLGDSVQSLAFLGPAAEWSAYLEFPNHGICLSNAATIEEVVFYFGHPAEAGRGRFTGQIVHRGATLNLPDEGEQGISSCLGEAYWRDRDRDETILFYELGTHEWQVEFGPDGRLKCFTISVPLLADPAQREAYRVTRTWPPR